MKFNLLFRPFIPSTEGRVIRKKLKPVCLFVCARSKVNFKKRGGRGKGEKTHSRAFEWMGMAENVRIAFSPLASCLDFHVIDEQYHKQKQRKFFLFFLNILVK
jgi:hypothetical protein